MYVAPFSGINVSHSVVHLYYLVQDSKELHKVRTVKNIPHVCVCGWINDYCKLA